MRERTPLTVDASELLRHPGSTQGFRLAHRMEGLALPLARIEEGSDFDLDLALDSVVEGIHVRGVVTGRVVLECRRCLTDFFQDLEVSVSDLYLPPGEGKEGEVYNIEDEWIDLEPLIRDAVVLSLPLNPLCREACAGLCTVCGADRNVTDCGHDQQKVDVRWGPLFRLRDDMEG